MLRKVRLATGTGVPVARRNQNMCKRNGKQCKGKLQRNYKHISGAALGKVTLATSDGAPVAHRKEASEVHFR